MIQAKNITIIDYGMGNIWSVINACRFLEHEPKVSSDPTEISAAECLIVPGVGSFARAMAALRENGIDHAIQDAAEKPSTRILGICLGMQLLGTESTEDGRTPGLGLMPGVVSKFTPSEDKQVKIPHVGFNLVNSSEDSQLFAGLPRAADFYFVHAYKMRAEGLDGLVATCHHGEEFAAAYEKDNIFATQFHPEKSQANGLTVLQNFLK